MARNRTKNEAIGTCVCPFKRCEIVAPLYRFRAATDNAAMQRQAGKLYLQCPTHGRTSDQEWLLANSDITGAPPAAPEPVGDGLIDDTAALQAKVDAPTKPEPAPAPAPAAEPKKSDSWGFF